MALPHEFCPQAAPFAPLMYSQGKRVKTNEQTKRGQIEGVGKTVDTHSACRSGRQALSYCDNVYGLNRRTVDVSGMMLTSYC